MKAVACCVMIIVSIDPAAPDIDTVGVMKVEYERQSWCEDAAATLDAVADMRAVCLPLEGK